MHCKKDTLRVRGAMMSPSYHSDTCIDERYQLLSVDKQDAFGILSSRYTVRKFHSEPVASSRDRVPIIVCSYGRGSDNLGHRAELDLVD